ncbi:MAG TPA: acyl-CoA dehydrogenase [Planctomycetota bacterium]|nr:acyl-CoA dehydrogenase [Planctomycetota bacterium]
MSTAGEILARIGREADELGLAHAGALLELDETAAAKRALRLLGDSGLAAWMVPAAFGGADAKGLVPADTVSVRAVSALRRSLAYRSAMLDVMLVMQGLGSFALTRAADPAIARDLLPRVARGELCAAFALTEPGAGSSLADVELRASRTASGWSLSGHKTFISNAGIADFYTVLARTADAPKTFTMFCVQASSPGLRTERFEVLGAHPIGDVYFEDVQVADSARLGELGNGIELALLVLARMRTSVAAAANGFARRAFDESRRHLLARQQFGKPLATMQGLAFDIAEMDTRLRAAELLVDEAAQAVDRGGDSTLEVARAKLFATENAGWVCDRAVQHFGGLGVKRGEVVEALYRDVRALRIYEGSSEVQKMILAKELFRRSS